MSFSGDHYKVPFDKSRVRVHRHTNPRRSLPRRCALHNGLCKFRLLQERRAHPQHQALRALASMTAVLWTTVFDFLRMRFPAFAAAASGAVSRIDVVVPFCCSNGLCCQSAKNKRTHNESRIQSPRHCHGSSPSLGCLRMILQRAAPSMKKLPPGNTHLLFNVNWGAAAEGGYFTVRAIQLPGGPRLVWP